MNKKILNLTLVVIIIISIFKIISSKIIYRENIQEQKYFSNIDNSVYIDISNINDIVYNEKLNVKFFLNVSKDYKITYKINELDYVEYIEKTEEYNTDLLLDEGKNEIEIDIYQDEYNILNYTKNVYFVKKINKQFLDELNHNGIIVHLDLKDYDKEKEYNLLTNLGITDIRTNIRWSGIGGYNRNEFNYDIYDARSDKLRSKFRFLIILDAPTNYFSNNRFISNEVEKEKYLNYAKQTINKYKNVANFEIMNEPNLIYKNESEYEYYINVLNSAINDNDFKKIISGGTVYTTSKEFLDKLLKNQNSGILANAVHLYDYEKNKTKLNSFYKEGLNTYKEILNNNGGFGKIIVTETGIQESSDETKQAKYLVQQQALLDYFGYKERYIYNFRNTSNEKNSNVFGIVTYDYTPKPSYYAMKNYYENTNGAEYIGTVNISDELEAHVYDKDGKPVIITWSENSTNNIQIDYKDFTAKDLYGKDIQPDENGKLTITTSPVYLYDVDYNYFYKAISNVATSKYDEFKEKFATEISQISGFEEKINQRQNYIQSVANTQKLMQNTAITAMKSHYELGNIILKSYEEGQLKVEPVKISSMLDMINDIGNSYEDIVTVSVNNTINSVMKTLDEANVDSSELTTTNQKIDEIENLINTNTDVEIIYPTKILQFSKDCYEKSDYINSLEEQNDIKAGLIISNNLHAQLLANWANKFASIQINNNINEYIAQNPVTIEYSETNITNKSVKATIKTNAEIQITNNSNSKEYVFDQNGSFTFEYTIKGQAKQITAKVTNIDKTLPIINGVIDGKLYTSKITPTITDENIDTIKLILNGEEVKNFKSGTTLTEEGFYTLTVIDKAGNKTQISFQIMENNNQNYIIQDNIIKNISEQTIKSDFDNKLKLGITYKIARNEKEISNTDSIATGDILTTSAGDKYTIIVTGDLNKDGKLNLKDLVKMRKYFLDGNNLDENEILAANCNFDGKINLKDLVKMRLMLLNQDATK